MKGAVMEKSKTVQEYFDITKDEAVQKIQEWYKSSSAKQLTVVKYGLYGLTGIGLFVWKEGMETQEQIGTIVEEPIERQNVQSYLKEFLGLGYEKFRLSLFGESGLTLTDTSKVGLQKEGELQKEKAHKEAEIWKASPKYKEMQAKKEAERARAKEKQTTVQVGKKKRIDWSELPEMLNKFSGQVYEVSKYYNCSFAAVRHQLLKLNLYDNETIVAKKRKRKPKGERTGLI